MKSAINIIVFKVISQTGRITFESRLRGDVGGVSSINLRVLARNVRNEATSHLQKDDTLQVLIDFAPLHSIEHSSGSNPRLYTKLSTEEVAEFWKYY